MKREFKYTKEPLEQFVDLIKDSINNSLDRGDKENKIMLDEANVLDLTIIDNKTIDVSIKFRGFDCACADETIDNFKEIYKYTWTVINK